MEVDQTVNTIVGKLHINYMENDILIHCTDNPGRTTILRTNVLQKQKQNEACSFQTAYQLCIDDLLSACQMSRVDRLYVKVINKRSDGITLLNEIMKAIVGRNIHIFPVTNLSSQPSSKTRRPPTDSHRRRYHKESYSRDINQEVQSWRN